MFASGNCGESKSGKKFVAVGESVNGSIAVDTGSVLGTVNGAGGESGSGDDGRPPGDRNPDEPPPPLDDSADDV